MTERVCACGCGRELPPLTQFNARRKWYSERCRKTQYAGTCEDCGARLGGSDGRGPNAPTRCARCAPVASGAVRKVWTCRAIIDAIHEWVAEHGEPPAAPDWRPTQARAMNDEARALRFEEADGHWPHVTTLVDEFGSWNAAITAAGHEPRAIGGGGGNGARRRNVRERVAA